MKTIAVLTMAFLPGTFVAVRYQLLSYDASMKLTRFGSRHSFLCHYLIGKRPSVCLFYRIASGFIGL